MTTVNVQAQRLDDQQIADNFSDIRPLLSASEAAVVSTQSSNVHFY